MRALEPLAFLDQAGRIVRRAQASPNSHDMRGLLVRLTTGALSSREGQPLTASGRCTAESSGKESHMSITDEGEVLVPDSHRSDAELLTAVRDGDMSAYGQLWSRHELAARRFATHIARPGDAEELVSESFYRVLRAINGGGGPQSAFRAYLFQAMRNANVDLGRGYLNRVVLTDEERVLDVVEASSAAEVSEEEAERGAAARAWASLPESARTLLWHLIIEENTPAQIAPILGISPNGVSSRAVRAKERLRQAFLQQQLKDAESEDCSQIRAKFGAYVRQTLPDSGRRQVEQHLASCLLGCPAALLEVKDINGTLRAVIAPLVLGGPLVAAKYLDHAGGADAGAAAGTGGSNSEIVRGLVVKAAHGSRYLALMAGAGAAAVFAGWLIAKEPGTRETAATTVARATVVSTPSSSTASVARSTHAAARSSARVSTSASASPSASVSVTKPPTGRRSANSPTSVPPAVSGPAQSAPLHPPARVTRAPVPKSTVRATVRPTRTQAPVPVKRVASVSILTGRYSGSGTLTATVPAGWQIVGTAQPPRARCDIAGQTATCALTNPVPGRHRFVFTVMPPSSQASGSMHVSYADRRGTTVQELQL
ncbi:MAG: hypothetical protein QOK10_3436 [Pseudonocardiales bacterium]|nr:hypothetical protein [Pseudonocardiales bacterium]